MAGRISYHQTAAVGLAVALSAALADVLAAGSAKRKRKAALMF
jgi:hypothetical protein